MQQRLVGYQVSPETMEQLATYLRRRPYDEVNHLMTQLQGSPPLTVTTPAQEPERGQEPH